MAAFVAIEYAAFSASCVVVYDGDDLRLIRRLITKANLCFNRH